VDLDHVEAGGCGIDAIVGAESIAEAVAAGAVEAGPAADSGGLAIGSDEPAKANVLAVDERSVVGFWLRVGIGGEVGGELDTGVEEQASAGCLCASGEQLVQVGTADSDARAVEEASVDVMHGVFEADAVENMAVLLIKGDAEVAERLSRVRHQALAAGFVDGAGAGLDNGAVDATLAESDGGSEPGRPTTYDENFSCFRELQTFIRH
jgi:hypothetical protein